MAVPAAAPKKPANQGGKAPANVQPVNHQEKAVSRITLQRSRLAALVVQERALADVQLLWMPDEDWSGLRRFR